MPLLFAGDPLLKDALKNVTFDKWTEYTESPQKRALPLDPCWCEFSVTWTEEFLVAN